MALDSANVVIVAAVKNIVSKSDASMKNIGLVMQWIEPGFRGKGVPLL